MVQFEQNPMIHKRSHFDPKQQENLNHDNKPMPNPYQDDFFIIGPSDSRFAPSVAYPNRLKNRSRSTSPGLTKMREEQKRSLSINHTGTEQIANQSRATNNATRSAPIQRAQTAHPMRNEAVQTDAPRKALEAEIQRIRADLERRKRELREPRVRVLDGNRNNLPTRPSNAMQPEVPNISFEPMPPTGLTNATPHAPRDVPRMAISRSEQDKRHRSNSPVGKPHRTEYQRAYRVPDMTRPQQFAQPIKRPRIARAQTGVSYHDRYESEYQREYKPFKYVPVEQLKSTTLQSQPGVHVVPVPRPRSAINLRPPNREMELTHTRGKPPTRSLTPPADGDRIRRLQKRRYLSEYAAKYRNFSQPVSRRQSPNKEHPKNVLSSWQAEWDQSRQQAELYRERDRGSHFCPHHFAQLYSASVDCWDPSSNSDPSSADRQAVLAQLAKPPAGKPSLATDWNLSTEPNGWTVDMRRNAMYDSHHVAEVLDPAEPWDDSSSESIKSDPSILNTRKPRQKQFNLAGMTGRTRPASRERLSSMFPQGQITRDPTPITRNSQFQTVSFENEPLSITSSPRSFVRGTTSGSSNYGDCNHWLDESDYRIEDRARKSPISTKLDIDPTVSFSSPSPLSVRSMVSSASIASETLERAKRQRDRVLNNYEKEQNITYSPSAYNDSLRRFRNGRACCT